jgi:hypothetical protein
MTWTITKTCGICEHYPYHEHCIGCRWDEGKGENTKWELKKNPIVIERAVLDKIRAEIEQVKVVMNEEIINHDRKDLINFVNGLNQSLMIIDKYKAESEE